MGKFELAEESVSLEIGQEWLSSVRYRKKNEENWIKSQKLVRHH